MDALTDAVEQLPAIECRPRNGLPNILAKLARGEEVVVAYLGGSITQAGDGWRAQSLEWLREEYPGANIREIAAAIGGTGSDLGIFRLQSDVLDYAPDLLFVEFAVNDTNTDRHQILCSMEGIVRKTWRAFPTCDICFVYTIAERDLNALREGKMSPSGTIHERVAECYGIPTIHMGLEIPKLLDSGDVVFTANGEEKEKYEAAGKTVFARDACHPHPEGHRFYTEAIKRSFALIKGLGAERPHNLPGALAPDNWEQASMVALSDKRIAKEKLVQMQRENWPEISWSPELLPELWQDEGDGARIRFRLNGTAFGIYDVVGPDTGELNICIDGQEAGQPFLRFDHHCSYRRSSYNVLAVNLASASHDIEIRLSKEMPDKRKIFEDNKFHFPENELFKNKRWYLSCLMFVGILEPPE